MDLRNKLESAPIQYVFRHMYTQCATVFWKRDISSASKKAFLGFSGKFYNRILNEDIDSNIVYF